MAFPFRFNKRERKRARRTAKAFLKLADKFEREGIKTCWVADLRESADLSLKLRLSKRKRNKRRS